MLYEEVYVQSQTTPSSSMFDIVSQCRAFISSLCNQAMPDEPSLVSKLVVYILDFIFTHLLKRYVMPESPIQGLN